MENIPHKPEREHKVISIPYGNGSKFDSWLRIFSSFAVGAVSSAFLLGGKSRDLGDLLTWRGEVRTKFEQVDQRLEHLDKDGTTHSKLTDQYQSDQISADLLRIIELEHKSEQINVMQGKIERLENEIKDVRDGNRK